MGQQSPAEAIKIMSGLMLDAQLLNSEAYAEYQVANWQLHSERPLLWQVCMAILAPPIYAFA